MPLENNLARDNRQIQIWKIKFSGFLHTGAGDGDLFPFFEVKSVIQSFLSSFMEISLGEKVQDACQVLGHRRMVNHTSLGRWIWGRWKSRIFYLISGLCILNLELVRNIWVSVKLGVFAYT